MSTCHDAISAREGVILTDYLHIMSTGHIHAGDPQTSSAYHSLNAGGENHMPPIGSGVVLTQDQKDAIYNWILQGAANNSCTETTCDSTSVSYSGSVVPILELYCFGCHSSTSAPNSGGGVALEPYSNLMTYVNNGFLIGDITHQNGYNAMPLGGNKLDDCKIGTIRNWINEGAQNN
ncbi:MAG: hypothetical protein GC178_15275 [Flavobacteriales bacterium]|nr:hypothetical protein [Flavobacteriales bacterium]